MPEQDDQISQNEATLNQLKSALEQAQANSKLAQVTWDRDRPLVGQGWATQQQGTIDVQTLKAQEAAVAVAQANVAAQEKLLMTLRQNRDYASGGRRRSTASSRSATSTSAAWCRATPTPAPSCSRSCRGT